ncbi:MAG: 3(2),5-bisphosphate nucleotidase [Myxococcaceae bacterium]|nr:3(2),5-bisphosphate nucleotidase [Myxococcaceae bacterium]MEA2750397.1 3(2), 5-bisphosphate nucleotidase [Myxococcales bacterium]
MTIDRQDVLTKLLDAARGASEIVMRIYAEDGDMGAELKGPNDPVTRADKEANAFILDKLKASLPGIPIVAEESDPSTFAGFEAAPVALFVDPVDGTRDFIAKNGEFCVMIGLAEAGRATVGVVLCPVFAGRRHTYAAAEGIGAFLVGDDDSKRALHVSSITELAQARCAVSRFHRSKSVDAKLAALGGKALIPIGSSGIKGVQVANGELELYVHPSRGKVKLWDACAPEAIVRAAGGIYTDAKGIPFDYRGPVAQGQGTIAANPTLHAEAIRRFAEYDKQTGGETIV